MPLHKKVPTLQVIILNSVSHILQKILCDSGVTKEELKPLVDYLSILLPPQIQSNLGECLLGSSNKMAIRFQHGMLNEKYIFLCTQLHVELLWLTYNEEMMPSVLGIVDGKNIKTLKVNRTPKFNDIYVDDDSCSLDRCEMLQPLYKFLFTLTNLSCIKFSQVCNNDMLEIVSSTCPNLEEVHVDMCTEVDDKGAFYLCGYDASDSNSREFVRSSVTPSKSGCKKLKTVNFEYTCVGIHGTAMILCLCPKIEELLVTPDVNIGDVFVMLHGSNPERYEEVRNRYALRILNNYMELDEDVLSLIVKTCPSMTVVTLRCNGVERKDRNLLANLLGLNVEVLDVMNCSMPALLWYLEQRGEKMRFLTIQHLSMAPMSLTFTRSHLQNVIKTCPNLTKFTLKLNNNPIQPDLPYSSFGSNLLHFTNLTHLTLEGLSITLEDLSIFISKCETLIELHIFILNLEILEDSAFFEFLATGCLRNLFYLFLYRPLLTLDALRRLVKECPKLYSVGPLSSWAIPKKDRETFAKEIEDNNWALNVKTPEMISMFQI